MQSFGAAKVITEKISDAHFKTYFVGFDSNNDGKKYYRLDELITLLTNVIPEFAFEYYCDEKITSINMVEKLREAAKSIYKIKEFRDLWEIYQQGGCISDESAEKEYLERGEFGELVLHLILRDFNNTVPLLSKIYFKDSYGLPPHGFDAVHIYPPEKSLWLGESKLYTNGRKGISALLKDVKDHFKRDYLQDEFAIISKRIKLYKEIPHKEYWLDLMHRSKKLLDVLHSVTIPLLLTYSSQNFVKYNDEALPQFITDYQQEVNELRDYFDKHNDHPLKTNLNIILMLFPVKCKDDLVRKMHEKLWMLQNI
ncbi:MAG: DUF1837 domain-containing protein [Candidatus Bathyarchaeia archaeon]|jgi:hypothetical protein